MLERWSRRFAAATLTSFLCGSALFAQAGLTHLGDATTPARGTFRLHASAAWTRYDARFATDGVAPLGGLFTSDSLGVRELPRLSVAESLVTEAAGAPFRLTLGRSRLDATAREEIMPVALDYGVTNRLSIGVMVPVIRKRVAVQFRLDTAGGFGANVGPNRHRTSAAAAQNNAIVQAELANAAQQLQARLSSCQANPTAPGCPALLAREAEALALIAASQAFAGQLERIYGSDTNNGQPFVPTADSDAQVAIEARIAQLNAQYRDLLTTSVDLLTAVPSGAGGPAGVADLQRYFAGDGVRDSVVTQERFGIGDVEVGLRFLAVHRPATDTRLFGIQLAVAAIVRLGTGSTDSPSEIVDMRLSPGDDHVDARAILDASYGRFGLLAAARHETAINAEERLDPTVDPNLDAPPSPVTDRSVTEISVAPRWHLSAPLSFHGAYSIRNADNTGTDQLVGGGLTFSGFRRTPAGGRAPSMEMRYTHLEAISGAAGQPRFFRDQIELRIYYRLRR
jgi:hypothetical protein